MWLQKSVPSMHSLRERGATSILRRRETGDPLDYVHDDYGVAGNGPSLEEKDKYGNNVMHYACRNGDEDFVKVLLEKLPAKLLTDKNEVRLSSCFLSRHARSLKYL